MFYVYLLESKTVDGKRYVGVTSNLKQRLADHNAGRSKHTARYLPWQLITYCIFGSKGRIVRALPEVRFRTRLCSKKALVDQANAGVAQW